MSAASGCSRMAESVVNGTSTSALEHRRHRQSSADHSPTSPRNRNRLSIQVPPVATNISNSRAVPAIASSTSSSTAMSYPSAQAAMDTGSNLGLGLGIGMVPSSLAGPLKQADEYNDTDAQALSALDEQRRMAMQSLEGSGHAAVSAQRHGTNRDSGTSSHATRGDHRTSAGAISNARSSLASTAQTSEDAHASSNWQQSGRSRITSATAASSSSSSTGNAGLGYHESRLRPNSDSHASIGASSESLHSSANVVPASSSSVASLAFSGGSFPSTSSLAPEVDAVPQQSPLEDGESADELDGGSLPSVNSPQSHLELHPARPEANSPAFHGRSLPESDAMFESTASGLFARGVAPAPGSSDTRATVSALASSSSASVGNGGGIGSASAHPHRKSFFSSLLSRSSSFNGHAQTSNVAQQGMSRSSSNAFPHTASTSSSSIPSGRVSTSSSPVLDRASGRRRTFSSSSRSHARHSSNPVPPSPTLLGASTNQSATAAALARAASPLLSRSVGPAAPPAHDSVFGPIPPSPVLTATRFTQHGSSQAQSATPSRASRIRQHFTSSTTSSMPGRSPTPNQSISHGDQRGMVRSATSDSVRDSKVPAQPPPPPLEALGLTLGPLSPSLSLGRYGQPLCGAVLDGKYLLIGTTLGLDFLPLNRAGNKAFRSGLFDRLAGAASSSASGSGHGSSASPLFASSSSGPGAAYEAGIEAAHASDWHAYTSRESRIRKPIPLIKKTRFKQLAILDQRSNVLLAVAGRNDHVRVYALDSLRAVIEKRIKEIDDKEGHPPVGSGRGVGIALGTGAPVGVKRNTSGIPPVPSLPHNYKGKERERLRPGMLGAASGSASSSAARSPSLPYLSSPSTTFTSPAMTPSSSAASALSTATSDLLEPPQLSPPPAYAYADRSSQSQPPSPRQQMSRSRRTSAHNTTSPVSAGTPSPSATQHQFAASSPRAMRRHKSRETIRRPSSAGSASASAAAAALGGGSRRGSAATVTPGTVASLAASTGSGSGRRRSSTATVSAHSVSRRSSANHLHARSPTAVHEEEDFEWVNADGGSLANGVRASAGSSGKKSRPSTAPSAANGAPDTAHSLPAGAAEAAEVGLRMRKGEAGAAVNPDTEDIALADPDVDAGFSADDEKTEAENLEEARMSPPPSPRSRGHQQARQQPSGPVGTIERTISSGAISSLSRSSNQTARRSQHQPRVAIALSPREDMASLADFLNDGPPLLPSASSAALSQRTSTIKQEITLHAQQTKLVARSPVAQVSIDEEEDDSTGPSLIDIMRAGPPASTGMTHCSLSTDSTSSSNGTPEAPRRLSKSASSPKVSASESASPAMSRSPAMPSLAAVATLASAIPAEGEDTSSVSMRQRTSSRSSDVAGGTSRHQLSAPASRSQVRSVSYQPRGPTFAEEQSFGEIVGRTPGMSLAEMLRAEPAPPASSGDGTSSSARPSGSAPTAAGLQRSNTNSSLASAGTAQGVGARQKKKRWSLLEGLRSPGSPELGTLLGNSTSASSLPPSASSVSLTDTPDGQAQLANSQHVPSPETMNGSGPPGVTTERSSSASTSMALLSSPNASQPPVLKRRPVGGEDEHAPFGNLISDLDQAQNSNHPDGTTITFTQTNVTTADTAAASATATSGARISSRSNGSGYPDTSVAGTLEYVKLARTKGARFIRASETSKRTYLAVLCGEQVERIELFTGSKNVSLSLNRTFVLPETPRTIEFQLQGEDLLDLYLIYDSAIFALEPSTVRVREVGIQRNERRAARRERERQLREVGTLTNENPALAHATADGPAPTTLVASSETPAEVTRAASPLGRLDSEGAHLSQQDSLDELPPPPLTPLGPNFTIPVPSTSEDTAAPVRSSAPPARPAPPVHSEASSDDPDTIPQPRRSTVSAGVGLGLEASLTDEPATSTSMTPAPVASSESQPFQDATATSTGLASTSGSTIPYTTFQQLEYLPPIPPSVLSSSYVIPPTYEAVLSASPMPAQEAFSRALSPNLGSSSRAISPAVNLLSNDAFTHAHTHSDSGMGQDPASTPLLNPVSLLANPAAKNNGPPGLFFVSKGKNSTGIVDGDGRSVIKKPVSWTSSETAPQVADAIGIDAFSRLEVVQTHAFEQSGLCLAAFGPACVRVVGLGHEYEQSIEVIPPEAFKRRQKSMASISAAAAQGKEWLLEDAAFVRDVTYLAKSGEATYFAERVGNGVMIHHLSAVGFSIPY